MRRIETLNSIYELDEDTQPARLRRLAGTKTDFIRDDGEWVPVREWFFEPGAKGFAFSQEGKGIITSTVISTTEE